MRRLIILLFFVFCGIVAAHAQVSELQLAQQYSLNGENLKALEIYQKLFKQDNETYFIGYVHTLIAAKKLDEAESVTKKMLRKHPGDYEYSVTLGKIYAEQGNAAKANEVYDGMIKNLPADAAVISTVATQFYQAENADYAIKIFLQGRKLLHNDQLYALELISLYRFKRDKANLTEEYLNLLPLNAAYISQAESTFSTLYEGEADYDMLRSALLRRIQKDPQETVFTDLLIWQYLQQKEFDQALNQALALNRRLNDDGNNILELCQTLSNNGAYDEAIRGYQYLIDKGRENVNYIPAKIQLINTKNQKITAGTYSKQDLLSLEKDYNDLLNEFGRKGGTAFAMQKLANLEAFKLHNLNEAQKLLEQVVNIPDVRPALLASCKLDLGDIYAMNNQVWDASLTYSQVEKANAGTPIAQDAAYRNAKLSYYTGDFKWAKGQLDVLKAATSQLIANDALNLSLMISENTVADTAGNALKMYARADMWIFKEEPARAMSTLDSIGQKYPGNSLADDILMAKARIYIQQKNYTAALAPLKKIAEEHKYDLWADDAVFMLGDLYENFLNNKDLAKTYYQRIITDYPGSLWINEARKRFRLLRGDKPDTSS